MDVKKVFIVGGGLMGSGIAQVCAQSGIEVLLNDISQEAIDKGLKNIAWSVGKLVEKGKLPEPKETILNRVKPCEDFSKAAGVDLAIEVVFEKLEVKHEIFKKFDEFCNKNALMATNTSAIPITAIAAVTKRPESVVGIHFFSPVSMMQAVEVVRGVSTSEESMKRGVAFVKSLGKEPIRVESDGAGFLLNRINIVSYVQAIRMLEEGIGTADDIDTGVKLAFGRRMGPFETGDMVGLDVSFNTLTAIYEETKDMRFYPPQLIRRKVQAGQLGRKTGKGWFEYNSDGTRKE
ncbi:MAG: 3-hydroxyacyl-CoA dehydrogenase family protein [Syntrophales bacterium]|nr:3-hydroxyacyl-CoA dehydrogenase family protein [Syntrophales bacterium]